MFKTLIKPIFADVKNFILDTLFPISCLVCGKAGFFVCDDCKIKLTKLHQQRCIICQKVTPFGYTHPSCQTPHTADGLISFYDYHDKNVSEIIIKGKYEFLPDVYKILGQLMGQKIKSNFPYLLSTSCYLLAPIPLHHSRKRWRGFNQAEILCQALSQELQIPILDVLQQCKATKTQKDLDRKDRFKNISSAFTINYKILNHKSYILNQNFILVDDVTTTGSTLLEAAKVLKRNGAAKVICLTVARD